MENLEIMKVFKPVSFNLNVLGWLNDLWKFDGTHWTWIAGEDWINKFGNYREKGIPDENNIPSSRRNTVSWIDSSNNFCLFGGYGYGKSGTLGS